MMKDIFDKVGVRRNCHVKSSTSIVPALLANRASLPSDRFRRALLSGSLSCTNGSDVWTVYHTTARAESFQAPAVRTVASCIALAVIILLIEHAGGYSKLFGFVICWMDHRIACRHLFVNMDGPALFA